MPLAAIGGALFFYGRGPNLDGVHLPAPRQRLAHDSVAGKKGQALVVRSDGSGGRGPWGTRLRAPDCSAPITVYADRDATIEMVRKNLPSCAHLVVFAFEDEQKERAFIAGSLIDDHTLSEKERVIGSLGPGQIAYIGLAYGVPLNTTIRLSTGNPVHYAFRADDTMQHALSVIADVELHLHAPVPAQVQRTFSLRPPHDPPTKLRGVTPCTCQPGDPLCWCE